MTSIADWHAFFDRYRQFERSQSYQAATEMLAGFRAFFRRVGPRMAELVVATRSEEALEAAQSARQFNVFRTLEIERKEEILHTRMLAHLLTPTAHHGQGFLFLKFFFDAARRHKGFAVPDEPLEEGRWFVQKEFYIAGVGELDLLIENARKRYVIVVENKIDSEDYEGQLVKYRVWMDSARYGYACRQLIYLTPGGRPPRFGKGCQCLQFSYGTDIRDFLNAAFEQVQAAPVKEVLRQYLSVVNGLMEQHDEQEE